MEKEVRYLEITELRKCGEKEDRTIEGYAVVFNSRSHDLGGFTEIIDPTALDGVLERSDVVLLMNHDNSRGILGRSKCGKGSLKLNVDERGLHFETKAPKTALGDEALEMIERGDANQCSFAFTVEAESWEKEGNSYLRTITKFDRIWDCSILTCEPAYPATECSCRSFEEFKAKEAEELRLAQEQKEKEQREAEEAELKAKIAEQHSKLIEDYKDYLK